MLVLTRKIGQQIKVGEILLTVIEIRDGKVQLGFQGPRDVVIDRMEVAQRKEADGDRSRNQ